MTEDKILAFCKTRKGKRKLTLNIENFEIELIKGYAGDVRRDFTLILRSITYFEFLTRLLNYDISTSGLPNLRGKLVEKSGPITIAQRVFFVADLKSNKVEKRDIEETCSEPAYSGGLVSPRDYFYILPERLAGFVHSLEQVLVCPSKAYRAFRKSGLIGENLGFWDQFYPEVFLAIEAKVSFEDFLRDAMKLMARKVCDDSPEFSMLKKIYFEGILDTD